MVCFWPTCSYKYLHYRITVYQSDQFQSVPPVPSMYLLDEAQEWFWIHAYFKVIRCQCPLQTIIVCHLDLPPKSTFISRLIRWTHMKVECLFRNAWEYLRIGEASGQHPPGLLRWEQGQGEPAVMRRRRLRQYLWDHNQHTQTLLRTPPTLMCQVCVTMNILTMFKPKYSNKESIIWWNLFIFSPTSEQFIKSITSDDLCKKTCYRVVGGSTSLT